jgi:predicted phage-related endonuclease
VQDSKDPFLAASLDALCSKNATVYEIKCGAKSYSITSATDKVPTYYAAQLQHMLMVTQLDSLLYASYRPSEELIILKIYRDESYIKELRKKEIKFMKELVKLGHKVQKKFHGKKVS